MAYVDPDKLIFWSNEPVFKSVSKVFLNGVSARLSFYEKKMQQSMQMSQAIIPRSNYKEIPQDLSN